MGDFTSFEKALFRLIVLTTIFWLAYFTILLCYLDMGGFKKLSLKKYIRVFFSRSMLTTFGSLLSFNFRMMVIPSVLCGVCFSLAAASLVPLHLWLSGAINHLPSPLYTFYYVECGTPIFASILILISRSLEREKLRSIRYGLPILHHLEKIKEGCL